MNLLAGLILLLVACVLCYLAFKFPDGKEGHYSIEVRLIGTAALILIMAIGFLTTSKPFCEIVPWFC